MNNSFAETDYITAKEEFLNCTGSKNEKLEAYILRKRKAELNGLVKEVISKELSPHEQTLVRLRWHDELTPTEIGLKLGVDRTTVSRRLERINEIVYEKLKYAVEYRYGKSYGQETKLIINSGEPYKAAIEPQKISRRIRKLRLEQSFSLKAAAKLTGLGEKRLEQLEKDAACMTADELRRLSLSYGCTSDYILFSNRH